MSLREILEDAESAINTYKHPKVDEARTRLNEILEAADLGSTGQDEITHLHVGRDYVTVRTSYYFRSQSLQDSFAFPAAILDANDPIVAAKFWSLRKLHDETLNEVNIAERNLFACKDRLAKISEKLAALSEGCN